MLRPTSLIISLTSQPSSVSRIPPPPGLARESHPPFTQGILNVAEPPGLALYLSRGIFFECNPVSQIPTFQEAALCQMEHSVAVRCERVLFCSFHYGMFPSGPCELKRLNAQNEGGFVSPPFVTSVRTSFEAPDKMEQRKVLRAGAEEILRVCRETTSQAAWIY